MNVRFPQLIGLSGFALLATLGLARVSSAHARLGTGAKHVLIIGIDGTRSDALLTASTPNLDGLAVVGASTYNAFAGGSPNPADPSHQNTSSGPGWSSILTGVWADRHGVYANPNFPNGNFDDFPHLFSRIRDVYPDAYLSSITQWSQINANLLNPFPGLASFTQHASGSGLAVRNASVSHLQNFDPDVLFVHFLDVDGTGHSSGFSPSNPNYIDALEQTDAYIGDILDAVENRPNYLNEDWLILVTADHGGTGTDHGEHSPAERMIWIIASGGDVIPQSVSSGPGHTVIARTALQHLGILVDPAWGFVDDEAFGLPALSATDPSPPDGSAALEIDTQLAWVPGVFATGHDVYFGTNPNPGPAEFQGNQSGNTFDPGLLAQSTTYYWRIDTINDRGVVPGEVWSFDTVSSTNGQMVVRLDFEGDLLDSSGNGNHPIAFGDPAFVPGVFGQGLDLDGDGDFLSLGVPSDLQFGPNTDFSVAFWMKSNGWTGDAAFLSNKNWINGINYGWVIAGSGNGSGWQWNFRGMSGAAVGFSMTDPVADGTWHHLAVTHDRDGDAVLYQDGVAIASVSIAGQGNIDAGWPTSIGQDGTQIYAHDMNATLDDVGIWRRALGAAEVAALSENGFPIGTNYCTSFDNSTGEAAQISAFGSPLVAVNDLTLQAHGVPRDGSGVFYFGTTQDTVPFGHGLRCVGGFTVRVNPPEISDGAGVATRVLDLNGPPAVGQINPGTTWHFQYWYRDNEAPLPFVFNLSDALTIDWL